MVYGERGRKGGGLTVVADVAEGCVLYVPGAAGDLNVVDLRSIVLVSIIDILGEE